MAKKFVWGRLKHIIETYLDLMSLFHESEDLFHAFKRLLGVYMDSIGDFALQIVQNLAFRYKRASELKPNDENYDFM